MLTRLSQSPPRRLRVAIDATPLLGTRTGAGVFTFGALEALSELGEIDLSAYAPAWRGRSAASRALPLGVRRIRTWLPGGRFDVMHGTNFVAPRGRRAARVVTVHDLAPIRFPELRTRETRPYLRHLRRAIAQRRVGAHPVRVRGPGGRSPARRRSRGASSPCRRASPRSRRETPPRAGAWRAPTATSSPSARSSPGRTTPRSVRAFDRLAAQRDDVNLVVAGADGWAVDTFGEEVRRARHGHRVVRLGYLDEAGRSALLRGASVFALPSRYEGFGFAPLEAMEAGVPVVATAVGSLPEVLGDAAVLVPPGDDEALSEGLARLLDDHDLQTRLMKAGRNRLSHYTWKACADGLAALYRRAAAAMTSSPRVSVVVPNWNGRHLIDRCLESVRAQTERDLEIIVVDNGSTDGSPEHLRNHHPDVRLVALADNQGFAGGVNAGVRVARGELVALLNNDAWAAPEWLERLAARLESEPAAGACAPKLYRDDGCEPTHRLDSTGELYSIWGLPFPRGSRRARPRAVRRRAGRVRRVRGGERLPRRALRRRRRFR